jgi:two-component system, chemotaxis family, chemotaxis protein CheY
MSKTVMIVDDSGSFRTVVKLALQKAGYAVVEAIDGKDAVRQAQRPEAQPDRLRRQHAQHGRAELPAPPEDDGGLQVHAGDHADHRVAGSRRRPRARPPAPSAWITKPFQPSQLVDAVNKLCV